MLRNVTVKQFQARYGACRLAEVLRTLLYLLFLAKVEWRTMARSV